MSEHELEPDGPAGPTEPGLDGSTTVDCDACIMRDTSTCDDCLVTFVVNREPGDALVIDAQEARAVRALQDGGLLPTLRLRRRVG